MLFIHYIIVAEGCNVKKAVSLILAAVTAFWTLTFVACADSDEYPFKTSDGRVRDPFVLEHNGKYYVYGTRLADNGYGCCVSEDLENWSAPKQVFAAYDGFDGVGDYWAPECHEYNGKFYLFATYRSGETQKRGTAVFVSDNPDGPFEPHSDGHVTPKYRDCIDGTLYIDENGVPWMFYVNEWTSEPDGIGGMAVVRMSDDLKQTVGEAKVIFNAKEAFRADGSITDGPFAYRTAGGRLLLLWSTDKKNGYCVGIAVSDNGRPDGNWYHHPVSLYEQDAFHELEGGHPMIFEKDGQLLMAIHAPNSCGEDFFETVHFIPVKDTGEMLIKDDADGFFQKTAYFLEQIYVSAYYFFREIINIF